MTSTIVVTVAQHAKTQNCHGTGRMDETLGGALPGRTDVPCINGCGEKQ